MNKVLCQKCLYRNARWNSLESRRFDLRFQHLPGDRPGPPSINTIFFKLTVRNIKQSQATPLPTSVLRNATFVWGGYKNSLTYCRSYLRPVFHLYVNLKREREARTCKIKRFSIVCIPYRRERDVNVKREFMTRDRVTWAWNRSLHVAIFHVHAQHSRATNKSKKTSFYARGNKETN